MKKIFVIDWSLIPLALFSAFSGIKLHVAGHTYSHDIWHNWAIAHIIISLLFFIFAISHIMMHRRWYKSAVINGIRRKSYITACLSLAFIITTTTGVLSLPTTETPNTNIGLLHYKVGIVFTVLSIIHVINRLSILKKSLNK